MDEVYDEFDLTEEQFYHLPVDIRKTVREPWVATRKPHEIIKKDTEKSSHQ